ncbi:hypothetical protein TWF694_003104 [Orbilia ellipsospora]|uniref:CHAT domain-containing protein n=1 Tax=Orbilia ellipsospora TaxID=2528407 RepID=A0AAV9X0M2_9PEZI
MSTQLHPLLELESLTSHAITKPADRQRVSDLFHQVSEYEYLGKFSEAYKALNSDAAASVLSAKSPSYSMFYGDVKFSQGYYHEGKESYEKALKILESATVELSEGSLQIRDFMSIRLLLLDPDSQENRRKGMERGLDSYVKWARDKDEADLDYFSILIQGLYSDMVKDLPPLSVRGDFLVSPTGTDLQPALLAALQPRFLEILYTQIPKGNSVVCFPIFLAKTNATKSLPELQGMQKKLEKLLKDNNAAQSLRMSVTGYCQVRSGQLSSGKDQEKYFKEGRKSFKEAGNTEAPCELDILETLLKSQKHILAGTDSRADVNRRIVYIIGELGKLYTKFTELDYPNRMHTVLRQIHSINDGMLGSRDITVITCRLWRQLGKATGLKIDTPTEFVAVMADLARTDDIEDSIAILEKFKREAGDDFDFELNLNWLRGMALAHYRLSLYDQAIEELEEAKRLLQGKFRSFEVYQITDQIFMYKQRRLQTLEGDEKGYAFDDLIEELDEAIKEEEQTTMRWEFWMKNMLTKALLLIGNKGVIGLERSVSEGGKVVASLERHIGRLVKQDEKKYEIFNVEIQRCKAILLKIQGKINESVSVIERLLPSKWKILKSKTEDQEIEEMQLRLLAVSVYILGAGTEPEDKVPSKTVEKRTKESLHHLKEAMKIAEKHRMAKDYCDALYYQAICHLNQNEPVKALECMYRSSRLQDEILRAAPRGDKFDTFLANSVAMGDYTGGMTDTAIKACLQIPDIVTAWWWIQKAKARAFSGMMGHGHIWHDSFNRIIDDISNLQMPWESVSVNFREIALVYRLEKLMKTPIGYTLDNWDQEEMQARMDARRTQIQELMDEIGQSPRIRGALGMSMGLPATHEDMTWLANYRQGDREIFFIDWICSNDDIIISIYQPGGMRWIQEWSLGTSKDTEIKMFSCKTGLKQAQAWVNEYIRNEDMPLGSKGSFDDLDILQELIEPIKWLTKPEDLLVLSPTNVLHGVPLHALKIDDGPNGERITLIDRNPVVYVPSFSILRQCVNRLRVAKPGDSSIPTDSYTRAATLIGVKVDYGNPDPAVPSSVERMAKSLDGVEVILNEDCTFDRFTSEAGNTTDILHFHGHMDYQDPRPLQRYLVLGNDEQITGRQLADLKFPKGTAPLVAIIACMSGGQQIMTGDEPIGIIPALLAAGASSVIATLWPTDSECGLMFGESLYRDRKGECDPYGDEDRDGTQKIWDIARGMRKVILEIKAREETSVPYYWAPFALYGSWMRGTGATGALGRGDGINGLSAQFARDMEIII